MNEHLVPKMTNSHVVKLSNSPAITPHREVPVLRRQDVDERPCVPRPELNGPTLRHFESQLDSPRINQRFPRLHTLNPITHPNHYLQINPIRLLQADFELEKFNRR